MKISTLLYLADHGQLVLPGFARSYIWNPTQVRNLFNSLYRGYPVGGLILWSVEASAMSVPPEVVKHCGRVDSVVDGHQRITAIYGVVRGDSAFLRPGVTWSLPPLYFHVADQTFDFRKPGVTNDPLWINLIDLFSRDHAGFGHYYEILYNSPGGPERVGEYAPRLNQLGGILNRNLAVEYMPSDASSEDAAEIHLLANGGGPRK